MFSTTPTLGKNRSLIIPSRVKAEPWTPDQLSNKVVNFDVQRAFDAGSITISSNNILRFRDNWNNLNFEQGLTVNQPKIADIGNKKAIHFLPDRGLRYVGTGGGITSARNAFWCIFLLRPFSTVPSTNTFRQVFGINAGGADEPYPGLNVRFSDGTTNNTMNFYYHGGRVDATTQYNFDEWYMMLWERSPDNAPFSDGGDKVAMWLNGVKEAESFTANGTKLITDDYIGLDFGVGTNIGNTSALAYVRDGYVVKGAPTQDDIDKAFGEMAWKHRDDLGLVAKLPFNHPYKNSRPRV